MPCYRSLTLLGVTICAAWLCAGCDDGGGYPNQADLIKFKDSAPANTKVQDDLTKLPLVNAEGEPVDLTQYLGKKNVVLVVTRGFTGSLEKKGDQSVGNLCIYCSTQTARLSTNYPAFAKRDTEVLVVFPVARASDADKLDLFRNTVKYAANPEKDIPFPLAIDLELKAVDQLGIRADLSKPATYILDKKGRVRYAYVGSSLSDRPSVKALLDELQKINKAGS